MKMQTTLSITQNGEAFPYNFLDAEDGTRPQKDDRAKMVTVAVDEIQRKNFVGIVTKKKHHAEESFQVLAHPEPLNAAHVAVMAKNNIVKNPPSLIDAARELTKATFYDAYFKERKPSSSEAGLVEDLHKAKQEMSDRIAADFGAGTRDQIERMATALTFQQHFKNEA